MRWGSVEARFEKRFKDVWVGSIASCRAEQFVYE